MRATTRFVFAILALVTLVLLILPNPGFYYPHVTIDIAGELTLDFLLNAKQEYSTCLKSASAISSTIQTSCPTCRVIQSHCLTTLTDTQRQRFTESPLSLPTARMQNGTVTYSSTRPQVALAACKESERQNSLSNTRNQLVCYQAHTIRPYLPNQTKNSKNIQTTLTLLLSTIGALLAILTISILATYKTITHKQKSVNIKPSRSAPGGSQSLQLKTTYNSPWLDKTSLVIVDAIILTVSFLASTSLTLNKLENNFDETLLFSHLIIVVITLAWFWILLEHYARRRPFWDELREIFRVLFLMFVVSGTGAFVVGLENIRENHLLTWIFNFLFIPIGRTAVRHLLHQLGLWQRPAVIIGSGKNAHEALLAINSEQAIGYKIICFIEPTPRNNGAASDFMGIPVLTIAPADIEETLKALGNHEIIVAMDSHTDTASQALIKKLTIHYRNIHLIPSIRGLPLFGTELSHFFSHEVLFITLRNNLSRQGYRLLKRIFDTISASILLVLLSPLMLYVAYRIWREDGRPIIFKQSRVARDKGEFQFLKFRSMVNNADAIIEQWKDKNSPEWQQYTENNFKLANDPRVLSIGEWIRATSIDELPQLINVIKGEMSLVGPRPLLPRELSHYGESIQLYRQTLPGITGLWQISGRSTTTFSERISLDAWYVKNWSLWYDIAIMFKTINVVIKRKGAY